MREDIESKISDCSTLQDLLLLMKDLIMLDTHVATLAYVNEIIQEYDSDVGFGIINCKPFPLDRGQESYNIQAYYFTNEGNNLTNGQIVVILFMDRNFINNLKVVNSEPKETQDLTTHTIKFGVVIKTM